MKSCVVFVTVRTDSTRLPRKALLKINNSPLIKILIDRIKNQKNVKRIVVCTTNSKTDDELVKFFRDNNIEFFRGPKLDIIKRLCYASRKFNVDKFVEVDGDDIFCDPNLISETCKIISENKYDFVFWEGLPFGSSPLGIRASKLEELLVKKTNRNTETGWGKLIVESGIFNTFEAHSKNTKLNRPEIRLTVDYNEDLVLAKKILKNLKSNFTLENIIQILDENPKWKKINENATKKYQENFMNKKIKLKLRGMKK